MNPERPLSAKADGEASFGRPASHPRFGPTQALLPRLLLWKKDLCQMLGVSLRTLERMISSGEIPPPNRRLRGRPAWLAAMIHEWAASGCPVSNRQAS